MDKSKIPKGCYCYDKETECPYWRMDERHKIKLNGYGYLPVVHCDFLKTNTMKMAVEEDWIEAIYLEDMCKICGENEPNTFAL